MKTARNLAIALVLILVAFLALKPLRGSSTRAKARRANAAAIQVGDSTNRVRSILGEPTESIAITGALTSALGGAAERWSYASSQDLMEWHPRQFPWIASLKFHFTDTNDLAVYFDSTGRVIRVQIPKR